MLFKQFQQDVRWILDCPSLLNCDTEALDCLQLQVSDIDSLPAPTSDVHKVGRYFEEIVATLLRHSPDVQLLERSLQILDSGRTVGELDFIYSHPEGRVTHCETAIKYYLYYAKPNPTESHFIGPNPNDTFESKLARLLTHQLPLSKKYYPQANHRQIFVKGIIFYPPNTNPPSTLPQCLNPKHRQGVWIYESELSYLSDFPDDFFALCQKPHWLARPYNTESYLPTAELVPLLENHFRQNSSPLMLSHLQRKKATLEERSRLFVVPDCWPNPTRLRGSGNKM